MADFHREFWIDRGGTFTDIISRNPDGTITSHKLLSDNPERYQDAVVQGIEDILHHFVVDLPPVGAIKTIKMGTTVATNALLERRGERVVLAITEGFADALRIGYQNRPEIFALNIILPAPLYESVIEIKERINAQGKVLHNLEENQVKQQLQEAYRQGFRTIAIVLMHGYRYTQHEKKIKQIAQDIGFTQISVSHEVAPVMKLIVRGDTTVVDAYLSPVLQNYIYGLQKKLANVPLFFMQSSGGLANAALFHGKDSIFSGPAGGVVGMVNTSKMAGFDKVIGFDMGGTSTDVSHFNGEYERIYSCEISGVRLHTPMMLINTIAAGGGSILHFDAQRFVVGPDSAGANPGPTCYRRGGPLTITDCNVLLGKIQAEFFPKVFGPQGNEAIDTESVRNSFQVLCDQINKEIGTQFSVEQIADGYLNVAVENMANAIKKISVQRGYEVALYLLNCFGGASGQHACLVADKLAMNTILIHPLAGVLSAYGMSFADISVFREQTIEKPLANSIKSTLKKLFVNLERDACEELKQQQVLTEDFLTIRRAHLRYEGSDTTLAVPYGKLLEMRNSFADLHRQTFGFVSSKVQLIIAAVSVEVMIHSQPISGTEQARQTSRSQADIPKLKTVKIFTHNEFYHAPVYERDQLLVGDLIKGCAIICESNTTTIVEPGWQVEVCNKKHLLLTRYQPLAKRTLIKTEVNPIMLEIFNNYFMSIAEQMGEVLQKTANSVNIKERLDFSCAIFDEQGELIANAPHIPVHLGSMSESVKELIKNKVSSMRPQDVYILNDPYHGGTHLPDITVITPVFDARGEQLLFLVGSRGHHTDVGGITPGSIPADSKSIHEEGILINQFKMVDRGHFLEKELVKLLTNAAYPARNPRQNIEDIKAQVAANNCGIHGLLNLVEQYGIDVVHAYMRHIRANAALSVKKVLPLLTAGSFSYALDDGSVIHVAIDIDKDKQQAKIDFTGSAAQHPGNFNAPTAVCKAAILYVMRCLIQEKIPLNNGCFEPLEIIIPPNSILNPKYPAAVVAGNVETSQYIVDVLLGALGVVAASQGTCNNVTFGNKKYQYYETICGGSGAGPDFNGTSAVHTHMTNTRLTDPEILEWRFPIILEQFSIRAHSGGKGKHTGGDGVIRRLRFLEPMTVNIISSHRVTKPYGLQGGEAGKAGQNSVQRVNGTIESYGGCARIEMQAGDVLIIETPGGGGFG